VRYKAIMAEPPAPPVLPPASPPHPWARTALWVGLALILVGGALYVFKSCRDLPGELAGKTSQVIDQAGHALANVAAAFKRGTVTTSFVSFATSVSNQQGLQFATLKQMERFTRSEMPSTAFGYLPLPEVVVEANAPVEYTYYLDLNADWRFVLEQNTLYVFTPPIRFNKPAVDVSALKFEVRKGALKRAEVRDNLQQSISSLVVLRARDSLPLVREIGRKQTQDFVERWLARSFTDGKNYAVKVIFPGEDPAPAPIPKPLN
jgi:hypothetical protein